MDTTTSIQLWYLSDGVMYSRSFRPSMSHARHWNVMAAKTLTVLKMITSSYGLTMPSRAYAETFRLYVFFAENIPSGAGLGGGSADAAYTVRALNTLFSLGLSNGAMAKLYLLSAPTVLFRLQQRHGSFRHRNNVAQGLNSDTERPHNSHLSP